VAGDSDSTHRISAAVNGLRRKDRMVGRFTYARICRVLRPWIAWRRKDPAGTTRS